MCLNRRRWCSVSGITLSAASLDYGDDSIGSVIRDDRDVLKYVNNRPGLIAGCFGSIFYGVLDNRRRYSRPTGAILSGACVVYSMPLMTTLPALGAGHNLGATRAPIFPKARSMSPPRATPVTHALASACRAADVTCVRNRGTPRAVPAGGHAS